MTDRPDRPDRPEQPEQSGVEREPEPLDTGRAMLRTAHPELFTGGSRARVAALVRVAAALWRTQQETLPDARRDRDADIASAAAVRDRRRREADDQRDARLAQLTEEEQRVRGEIESTARDETAKTDAQAADDFARTKAAREDSLAKARSQRDEKVWLAETVFESGRPKPIAECERAHGLIREGLGELDGISQELALLAGPALRARETSHQAADQTGDAPDAGDDTDPSPESFRAAVDEARGHFDALRAHVPSRLVRSGVAYILPPVLAAGAAGGAWVVAGFSGWGVPAGVGAGVLAATGAGAVWLRSRMKTFARLEGGRGLGACERARSHAIGAAESADQRRDAMLAALKDKAQSDRQAALDAFAGREGEIKRAFHNRAEVIESERAERAARIASKRDEEAAALDRRAARHRGDTLASHEQQTREIERAHDDAVASAEAAFDEAVRAAQQAWQAATQASGETARTLSRDAEAAAPGWSGPVRSERSAWDADAWAGWSPPTGSASLAPIGRVRVELPGPPDATPQSAGEPTRGAVLDPPLALDVPGGLSLLIEADQMHRDLGIETLRCAMLRLLCALPPGRVRFTLLDPVGLGQSFAGFARLGDHDPRLIAGRIWSEQRHIEQRLADLTEHMENVIQKYLRDEFESIEAYNTAAGEIAEAYRVLVIADFPRGFNDEALRRLASIADSGARCGVHTMILTDPKEQPPAGVSMPALREGSLVLRSQGGRLRPGGAPLADAHVEIDPPAPDALSASLVEKVGAASLDAGRVEVPFATLSPESLWSRSTRDELRVPIGRTGATRQQELVLGHGTAQHALLAGKTGSGKSTLLHVLITAAAQWHSPDELELYLVDFKKGVEFKAYADGSLPHVRAVAIESDREFGLSVLEKLDAVLRERGEVFRKQGVQSLPQCRRDHPGGVMPRVVLVVDEFQELFVEDDRVAQEASLLLDRLVRQGRAFGVHVLLGSQTLSGAYTLARSTMGQMGVRVALQCSETDSYLILSEDNGAARLLTRPGEAIYNDQGGLVEGNSPFQTAWLADHDRDDALAGVGAHAASAGVSRPAPIVFEGNEPGDLTRNAALGDALARVPETPPPALRVWLGEPVSIKDPASGVLRRRTGSNLLLVGADEDAALGMLASGLIGLGAQLPAAHGSFVLVDGLPEDDPRSWLLGAVGDALPQPVHAAGWREAETAVRSVHETVRTRERDNILDGEPAVLVLNGLHRLRALRRKDDDFSFSMDDNAETSVDKLLEEIVRDGPGVGVFTIAWCDSSANLSRALGRQAIGEFDQRVLMQMSAADSSALGESGSAARLGPHRALLFSLETGAEEKLRPYRVPTRGDVESLAQRLRARREG